MDEVTTTALEELRLFHNHLAAWLARGTLEAWAYLADAFDGGFELIALDGARIDSPALVSALLSQGGSQPGLDIEVLDPRIHLQDAQHVWVTFFERHGGGESRITTAFLVRTSTRSQRWRWRFVQETPAPPSPH